METEKLIDKLMDNHTKYNQTVEDYKENGEEDFMSWLRYELKKRGVENVY